MPDDERVEVHSVWAVEMFGPGTIDRLLEGVARLGVDGNRLESPLGEAVGRTRSGDLVVSSAELSPLVRPGDSQVVSSLFVPPVEAALPEGFHRIFLQWMSVTASLSAVVVRVDLTRHAGLTAHRALSAHAPGGRWQEGPLRTRRELPAMQQRRRFLEALLAYGVGASHWLADHLPGEFALRGLRAPATAMVTARLFDPFAEQPPGDPLRQSYRYAAGLRETPELRNTLNPAVACAPLRSTDMRRDTRMLLVGGRAIDVATGWRAQDGESPPPADASGRRLHQDIVSGSAERLTGPAVCFAVSKLLGDLLVDLSRARDQPVEHRGVGGRRRQLTDELEATGRLVDAGHLAEDLREGVFPLLFGSYDGSDFTHADPDPRWQRSLQEDLDSEARRLAELVLQRERRVVDALSIRADLHAAIAGAEAVLWAAGAMAVAIVAIVVSLLVR